MKTKVKQGQYLFPVRDTNDADKVTLVPVSKTFYVNACRVISRKRKQLQRSGECCCPKKLLWKCDGDCERCRFSLAGEQPLCLDAPASEDENVSLMDTIADDSPLPEEIAVGKALLNALYKELDALAPEGRRICELLSRLSEREAAKVMGMSRSTFKRHWAKVQTRLAKRLGDYI